MLLSSTIVVDSIRFLTPIYLYYSPHTWLLLRFCGTNVTVFSSLSAFCPPNFFVPTCYSHRNCFGISFFSDRYNSITFFGEALWSSSIDNSHLRIEEQPPGLGPTARVQSGVLPVAASIVLLAYLFTKAIASLVFWDIFAKEKLP